ncbi:MAG: hypothetical protein IPO87_06445 [Flavobacteriales bacterium]|nr:hypothetical protein [Flavobacteriales bacterium]
MMVKPSTAESYRSNISEKTGARTRLGMFMMAVRFGLGKVEAFLPDPVAVEYPRTGAEVICT